MRWATVGSGTRNARAISSVVAHVIVEGRVEIRHGRFLLDLELPT